MVLDPMRCTAIYLLSALVKILVFQEVMRYLAVLLSVTKNSLITNLLGPNSIPTTTSLAILYSANRIVPTKFPKAQTTFISFSLS